ncbi:hypothetical protein HH303_15865 [Rhodospirillaceae bacterium KN72]|uniref:Uncharacterized protein n=1 Tax=Pacificispira spongiicola TaxID=2729598 RepID=A0A7Y0E2F2_9PROT|nr:hypothetical protein [Pacificispira spongiicola]NMM45974.1 hypothetical protein [Pacificispira spongiicola]
MEIRVPHQVIYQTTGESSIDDVIVSLMGTRAAVREAGQLLEACFDGLKVETSTAQVRSITQESPLREVFFVSLMVGFQDGLETEIPEVLEKLFESQIPDQYDTIVTVCTLVILFYGADFLYRKYLKATETASVSKQLDGLISELSSLTGRSEDAIRAILKERYKGRRLVDLGRATANFFRPSKKQGNAAVKVGNTDVASSTVAEIPADFSDAAAKPEPTSESMEDVLIEVHAQDVDYANRGWAAVIPSVSSDRVRMKVFPPIKLEDVYNRGTLRGDIILISETVGDEVRPVECHLVRLYDDA